MRFFNKLPIWGQIYLPVFLMVLILSIAGNAYFYRSGREKSLMLFNKRLQTSLELLSNSLARYYESGNFGRTEELFRAFTRPFPEIRGARIRNQHGKVLLHHGIGNFPLTNAPGITEVTRYNFITTKRIQSPGLKKTIGYGFVEVFFNTRDLHQPMLQQGRFRILFDCMILAAIATLLNIILLRILRPAREISAVMDKVRTEEKYYQIEHSWENEWGLIADSFNKMIKTIEEHANEIQAQNFLLKSTLNHLEDCLLLMDRDFKVLEVNRAFLRKVKMKKEEIVGQKVADLPFAHFLDPINLQEKFSSEDSFIYNDFQLSFKKDEKSKFYGFFTNYVTDRKILFHLLVLKDMSKIQKAYTQESLLKKAEKKNLRLEKELENLKGKKGNR
ncbi:hypothetical protein ACFL35_11875 [Candidatus Riflebacteria bacterium]